MFVIYGGATVLNQWEQGKMLTNEHMQVGDCVLFRSGNGKAIPMTARQEGSDIVVDVPNILLMDHRNIVVDLTTYRECRTIIGVNECNRPDDYTFIDNCSRRGSGVTPDWNQNDPNAPDYIKNRPFYTETKTLLETQTIEGFADEYGIGIYAITLPQKLGLEDGEAIVMWDGYEYRTEVRMYEGGAEIGNTSLEEGLGSGEPFVISESSDGGITIVVANGSTSTSHTVGIMLNKGCKIDQKYLPKSIGKTIIDPHEISEYMVMNLDDRHRDGFEELSVHAMRVDQYNAMYDMIKWCEVNNGFFYDLRENCKWDFSIEQPSPDNNFHESIHCTATRIIADETGLSVACMDHVLYLENDAVWMRCADTWTTMVDKEQ